MHQMQQFFSSSFGSSIVLAYTLDGVFYQNISDGTYMADCDMEWRQLILYGEAVRFKALDNIAK
jgi:hypothetical protein